jgi:hypothetical protein
MTIKEFKTWVNNIPEEMEEFSVVIRTLQTTEEEGKFGQKDDPIVSALVDQTLKRLCVFNIESQQVIQEIRKTLPAKEESGETKEDQPAADPQ